jgi:glycosyltransferase involved in cell wall biosynthesis
MDTTLNLRLVMLGAVSETRSSIAAVVETYRANGLFRRWPIDYLATHGDVGLLQNLSLALNALRRFAALLARHRRVVLHAHCAFDAGFWREAVFMAVAIAARCPVILQLHGSGFERFYDHSSSPARALIRFFLERAACVAVPSESLRAWTRGIARESNPVCLPNPVPESSVQRQADGQNLVLFLGRLDAGKGIYDLLEAIAALRAESSAHSAAELSAPLSDTRLVCAGEGDRAGVARYAQQLGIADAVKFTGWVGPSGKRALLEHAALFALPSYDETMPMSVLEAMSAGVPVVVSPVGGLPEVVVDGVSGYLVAPGDTATLKRALGRLLVDRKLGERVGAAGRESVRLRYAPERVLPELENLYTAAGLNGLAKRPVLAT